MRGFIDDDVAALRRIAGDEASQSAFMRGFIDDKEHDGLRHPPALVSIRVHARLHR